MNTITRFALRFAALLALTLAVMASVSVKASREPIAGKLGPASALQSAVPMDTRNIRVDQPPG